MGERPGLNGTTDVAPGPVAGRGCLWAFVALVLVSVLSATVVAADDDAEPTGPDDHGAVDVCRQKVMEHLVAPDTVEWPGDEAVTHAGAEYTVAGAVESENGFGMLVRDEWVCTATWVDGPRWKPVVTALVD